LIKLLDGLEIRVGRGAMRGLGKAEIVEVRHVDAEPSNVYMALAYVRDSLGATTLATDTTIVEVWRSKKQGASLAQRRWWWGEAYMPGTLLLFSRELTVDEYVDLARRELESGLGFAVPIHSLSDLINLLAP